MVKPPVRVNLTVSLSETPEHELIASANTTSAKGMKAAVKFEKTLEKIFFIFTSPVAGLFSATI